MDIEDKFDASVATQSAKSKGSIIKSCARYGVLPCLQANNLACSCFVDAVRRHKIPESETKDFTTQSKISIFEASQSFVLAFHAPEVPQNWHKGAMMDAWAHSELY